MASDKAVNKVMLGSQTIVDMTDATATADDILPGRSAYLANGVNTEGTANVVTGISYASGILSVTYSSGTTDSINILDMAMYPSAYLYPHA